MQIKIDNKIAERLRKRVDESDEFENVEEYVDYILKQIIERLDSEKQEEKQTYSEEDEKKVKERLRGLGYLD